MAEIPDGGSDNRLHQAAGFTLMEVLVSVAVVGICLGTLLVIFSQGHQMAFKSQLAKEAAKGARLLIRSWKAEGYPSEEKGDVPGLDGWRFQFTAAAEPPVIQLIPAAGLSSSGEELYQEADGGAQVIVEPEDLRLARLKLIPPDSGSPFIMEFLIRKQELTRND